MSTAVVQY